MNRKYQKKCGCVRITDDVGVFTSHRCDTHKRSEPSTPSQQAKSEGLKSLSMVSEITGVSLQTLGNWHRDKPKLFAVVLAGCKALNDN